MESRQLAEPADREEQTVIVVTFTRPLNEEQAKNAIAAMLREFVRKLYHSD